MLAAAGWPGENAGSVCAEYIPTQHQTDTVPLSPDSIPHPTDDTALVDALRRVLGPLARLMLARGMTLPLAVELLKRVLVETAERDFRLESKAVTDSRISLLTGVHRKDVKRLRSLPRVDAPLPHKVSLGAQLVGRWVTQKPWVDRGGRPKRLPRLYSQGGKASFEALVASVSRDIRPRSVLDEWIRLNVVTLNEADEVVLNTAAFVPREGADEKLHYLGLNVGDHAETAANNVLGREPRFDRSVHHDGLSEEQVQRLRRRAAELGTAMLQTLHAEVEMMQQQARPAAPAQRFTCGVYWYDGDDHGSQSGESR
jgi:hypothetical protein